MEHYAQITVMTFINLLVQLTHQFVQMQADGQFLQTQLKIKLLDGTADINFTLSQCKEEQRFTMIL
jgi:hypothetical protein